MSIESPNIKKTEERNLMMRFNWKHAAIFSLLALIPWDSAAQMEKITESEKAEAAKRLPALFESAKNPYLKSWLGAVRRSNDARAIVNAVRVTDDIAPSFKGKVVHYAVPAMGDVQRLGDVYPIDGTAHGIVRIIMAQDEYEPGSFVVYPLEDLGKVEFKLTPFKTADGKVLPADKLDMKVIKIWYQNGNGWYSYFGDTGLKLTPELLLNDEDLIKVDTKAEQNYARVKNDKGGYDYIWISAPEEMDKMVGYPSYRSFQPFQPMRPNFTDAKTLQPVTLNRGEFKQLFLTVRAEKNQAPGLYKGAVNMVKNGVQIGTIPVTVKIMPFVLPKPAAYYDVNKPFLVSSYSYISYDLAMNENGGDLELAKKQIEATLANQVSHNQDMHMIRGRTFEDEFMFTLNTVKKVGMRTDYFMGGGPGRAGSSTLDRQQDARAMRARCLSLVGHTNFFFGYGDEPPASWFVRLRPMFRDYQKEGFKFFIAAKDQAFYAAGYFYDFFNTAYFPEQREPTRKWNEVGHAFVAWYAAQHIGAENPSYNRRQNGLVPYLANYSALCNYAHHFGSYNDRRLTYKPMVYAYGCGDGVIDTIQWEGFREGLDDIRYATLMKRLALEADKHKDIDIQYQGRIALQYLAELDATSYDLATARLEMIRMILNLKKLLNK